MRFSYLLPVLLALSSLVSCKKDKDEPDPNGYEYELKYNEGTYVIDAGRVWDYKLGRYPSHNTYAYFLLDGQSFSQGGDYDLESDDPPISIFYFLSVPKDRSSIMGTFEFHKLSANWWETGLPENVKNKQVFTDAIVGFDANGDKKISQSESIKVTGGVIISNGPVQEYDLTLENGKKLTGSLSAKIHTQLPPA